MAEDGGGVDGAHIELLPSSAVQQRDEAARSRIETLKLSTAANLRGFFQLEAVRPGDYVLTATREPQASARVTVRVLEGQATEVADPPVVLRLPRTLEIFVDPPSPPGLGLWTAKLLQMDSRSNVMETFADTAITADGAWLVEGIAIGTYSLSIASANGDRWFQQLLEVEADPQPVFITIPAIEVRGSVKLGEEPLSARLVFGGKYGALSVTLATDEEGAFAGLLPRAGVWEIEAEVSDPPIKKRMQKEVTDGEDLEIVFPDTRVQGTVVDEQGRNVGRAIVKITNLEEPGGASNPWTDERGQFEVVEHL